ncbi:uncharacterized protein M6B38_266185 [Iris pallida]|uniref:Uncharacterized protein n=1 Tax=Iris pallida TaxID=29817 RepID=A0AAX6IAA9_IRIPA|nr:uncharacterized protein M6B38_266185 [Iris pallida]
MQDPFPIPSCFASGPRADKFPDNPMSVFASTTKSSSSGQSIVTSVYRTKIAGHVRLINVSWCRNLLAHCLCVSVEGPDAGGAADDGIAGPNVCKVELRPWYFWRKAGSKKFYTPGKEAVRVFWDLRAARFDGDPEPRSNFYVALVHDGEAVLLLGDLGANEACRRTGSRPPAIEAALLSKKEHVFGKKRFVTRSKFDGKGKAHDIVIECGIGGGRTDPEMVVRIDGDVAVHVKHLQWKFRGNETVVVGGSKRRVEVCWDVHGWLFGPGPRHALFIFKPLPAPRSAALAASAPSAAPPLTTGAGDRRHGSAAPESCLFLYAWKLE